MAEAGDPATAASVAAVKLWDLPVRLVHWAIVLLLAGLWWTAEEGNLTVHKQLGMMMLILIVFRLLWGFVGSSSARFVGFLRGPGAVIGYARGLFGRGAGEPVVGHNPLGGWSAMILLALLAVQVGLGLIAQDTDGLESGPLNHLVDYDTAEWARETHEQIFNVLLGLSVVHVLAIVFYLMFKRDNLIFPMLTGKRRFTRAVAAPKLAPWWLAVLCLIIAWAIGGWVWSGAPLP